jgi:hypothetical protein
MATKLRVTKVRLHENIGGIDKVFQPGEIFEHDDDKRAQTLLDVTPAIVEEPKDRDYLDYAARAAKLGVEVPKFVEERLLEIQAKRGTTPVKKSGGKKAGTKSGAAAGGAATEEKDE